MPRAVYERVRRLGRGVPVRRRGRRAVRPSRAAIARWSIVPGVEVIHFGRVSSRQNLDLRGPEPDDRLRPLSTEERRVATALWVYKIVFTVDAPVQLLGKAVQYLWRRLAGAETRESAKEPTRDSRRVVVSDA